MQTGVREEVADSINNFFAQLTWSDDDAEDEIDLAQIDASANDEELEDMADFLAQLNDEEMEKLNNLIQAKREEMSEDEF